MNNRILKIAVVSAQVLNLVLYALIVLMVFIGIELLVSDNPTTLNFVSITESGFQFTTDSPMLEKQMSPDKRAGVVLNAIILAIEFLLITLMVRQGMYIIKSIQSFKTFHSTNILAFRYIGHYFAALFLLGILDIAYADPGYTLTFSFSPFALVGMISAYIMAEVFREGNRLMEENKLTI